MARAADFRLSAGFRTHPKILRLERLLGEAGIVCWVALLAHAAQYKPDGRLAGMDAEEIALASQWKGVPAEFVSALKDARLLDEKAGCLSLHDWREHNGYAASYKKRSEHGRRAAKRRWEKESGASQCPSIARASKADGSGNAPSPDPDPFPTPTPSPTPKNRSKRSQDGHPDPDFVKAWSIYPKRSGTNSKADAHGAWSASIHRGADPAEMLKGVERYAAYARAEGIVGQSYVMAAARFFGKGEHWKQDWTVSVGDGGASKVATGAPLQEVRKEIGFD